MFTYFIILAAALAGPLALSFDKKVAFYKQWKYLFPAMLLPAAFYMVWDSYFTSIGIWQFNEKYITGLRLGNLPIEEVLFFFVVPYCCVFIYTCIRSYFPVMPDGKTPKRALSLLAIVLLAVALLNITHRYTSVTFILAAIFITAILFFRSFFKQLHLRAFLISYLIILIPFLVVNGFLTAIPVVIYNDAENLGLRIYTIPVEDIFYGMLLVMMNVSIYEKLRSK